MQETDTRVNCEGGMLARPWMERELSKAYDNDNIKFLDPW